MEVYRLLDRKADAAAVSEALGHKAGQDTVDALLAKVRSGEAARRVVGGAIRRLA